MDYTEAQMADMLQRIQKNMKGALGMDMPPVNVKSVSLGDIVAIVDRVLIGTVHKGGEPPKKAPAPAPVHSSH